MESQVIIGSAFPKIVCPLIENAKHSIKIIIYDWRLYPNDPSHPVSLLVRALKGAVERNVDVKVLLSNDAVRRQLSGLGFTCKLLHSPQLVHAKMMLLDNRVAVVGSHNYTQNAFALNLEVSVALDLGSEDNAGVEYFDNLWSV